MAGMMGTWYACERCECPVEVQLPLDASCVPAVLQQWKAPSAVVE